MSGIKKMKPKLSVILPGIRVHNWHKLYKSVEDSFSGTFEVIIVSPYDLPPELANYDNIKHIVDHGCPSRCQQIGLVNCSGEFVTWGADDGWFLQNSLDEAIKLWELSATCDKDVVTCKYTESQENTKCSPDMYEDFYYKINHASGLRSAFIPDDYWILNIGIAKTEYVKEIGGWDSMFEVTTISHMDFAARTQRNGSRYFMKRFPIFACDHMPGTMGDHGPVHYSHIEHDEPLFRKIYNQSKSIDRVKIDINNWQKTDKIWKRRFGNV